MEGPILLDTESESIDISSIKFAVLHGLEVSGKQTTLVVDAWFVAKY